MNHGVLLGPLSLIKEFRQMKTVWPKNIDLTANRRFREPSLSEPKDDLSHYWIMFLISSHNLAITNTRRRLWMIIWCEIINVWSLSDILLISMVLIMTHSFSSCQWLDIFSRVVNTFSGHYSILLLIIHLLNIKRSPLPAENKPKIKLNLLGVLLDTFICKEKKRLMSKKLFHVIKLSHRKIK